MSDTARSLMAYRARAALLSDASVEYGPVMFLTMSEHCDRMLRLTAMYLIGEGC